MSCLRKNQAWSEERRREDPHYFERLSNLQRPQYLWIGCSDSRVPANTIILRHHQWASRSELKQNYSQS